MLETTRIRREGFSVRPKFSEFISLYRAFCSPRFSSVLDNNSVTCRYILERVNVTGVLFGKTKLFMKYFHVETLDTILKLHNRYAIVIQKWVRGYLARKAIALLFQISKEQTSEALRFIAEISASGSTLYKIGEPSGVVIGKSALKPRQEQQSNELIVLRSEKNQLVLEQEKNQAEIMRLALALKRTLVDKKEAVSTLAHADLESFLRNRELQLRLAISELSEKEVVSCLAYQNAHDAVLAKIAIRDTLISETLLTQNLVTCDNETVDIKLKIMMAQFNAQEKDMEEKRSALVSLAQHVEHQRDCLEIYRNEHVWVSSKLTEVLVERSSTLINHYQAEGDKMVKENENRLTSQKTALISLKEEHHSTVTQLQAVVTSAQNETLQLEVKLGQQKALFAGRLTEMAEAGVASRATLVQKEERLAKLTMLHEIERRDIQSKLKMLENTRTSGKEVHAGALQVLQMDLRQKTLLLQKATDEKEGAARELQTKIEIGEKDAASGLQPALHAQNLQLEIAISDKSQLSDTLQRQITLLEIAKNEGKVAIEDLQFSMETDKSYWFTKVRFFKKKVIAISSLFYTE